MQRLFFSGDVVERQTYLNGTRYYLVEAIAENDVTRSLTLSMTLPKEGGEAITEGDLSLGGDDFAWDGDVVAGSFEEEFDETLDAPRVTVTLALRRRDESDGAEQWDGADAVVRLAADSCEVEVKLS
jgi:hypothetical protein